MTAVRTMVVCCPDWPAVAAGVATVPAAVVFANRVVACSAAARADGVKVGLRRREAQGRCPELVVVEQDPGRDARAFESVVTAVEAFTPRVEVVRPGLVAFGSRGPSRYFGGDRALAGRIVTVVNAVLSSLGAPSCQVGVADGEFAAELAAGAAGAAGAAVLVVAPGKGAAFLAPFPVSTLQRPDLADLLTRLGLTTLGDLAALPADVVLARFGPEGALAHRLARGEEERPLDLRTPPLDLTVTAELDPPADRVDVAAFTAKALADQLHQQLATLGLACTRMAIEVETEHGEHLVRLWRHEGALTAGAIAERVRWQLDGWLNSGAATAGITLLRLIPDEIKPDHGRQLGFWGSSRAADDQAARSLARIQGMLGPTGVVTAVMSGGRDPVDWVQFVPWGDPREPVRPGPPVASDSPVRPGAPAAHGPSARPLRRTMGAAAGETPPWPGHVPMPAPAVVHTDLIPVQVRDREGRSVTVTARGLMSEAPGVLSVAGGPWTPVAGWAGPWLAEERWWEASSARRRARFQMVVGDGSAYLVVLEAGTWRLEASYD
jgi:protein ImuB